MQTNQTGLAVATPWLLLPALALCMSACGDETGARSDVADVADAPEDTADDAAEILPDTDVTPGVDTGPDDPGTDPGLDPATDAEEDPAQDPTGDPGDDVLPVDPNACGGMAELLFDGGPAQPLDRCGDTASGFLVCNGVDALLCLGEPASNVCGGVGELRATPGDACGCDGVWTCEDGGVVCAGGSGPNACGGCASLIAEPGYACELAGGGAGDWQCAGSDAVTCGIDNVCGGSGVLEPAAAALGQACESSCGSGVWACEGADAWVCRPNVPCNACGGTALLAGLPDEACGVFGDGTWACDGTDRVVCDGATLPNVCGGSAVLTNAPGDSCGERQQYVCVGDELRCQAVADPVDGNACGGTSVLDGEPGTPCGACGKGLWQCADTNSVACTVPDEAQRNACGGCGGLVGDVNLACGVCGDGTLACNAGGDALVCEDAARTPNVCGGCGPVDGAVGEDCGPCGQYACNPDTRRLVCVPRPVGACALTCADIGETCTAASRTCVAAAEGVDATCGNCLAGYEEVGGNCLSPIPAPTGVVASDGTSAAQVTVTWEEVAGATGYLVYRNGDQITPTAVTATSYNDTTAPAGGAPPIVAGVATDNFFGYVRVTWAVARPPAGDIQTYTVVALADARRSVASAEDTGYRRAQPVTRYEVELRGTWVAVGAGTSYNDSDAPLGTITTGAPTATNNRANGIHLATGLPRTSAGAVQSYRVRAVNAAGNGLASASANGWRRVGPPTFQWQRAITEAGSYADLAGATAATYLDTSVGAGQERWYRVVVSAAGAAAVTGPASGGVAGMRVEPGEGLGELGEFCRADANCPADAWCPTDTTERRCSPSPELAAGVQMPFQYIPAGSFMMGSPAGELGRYSHETQVSVTLSRPFFVQRTEATQAQWTALSGGTNPSCFQSTTGTSCTSTNANPNGPVERVSWWSLVGYANALSAAQGLPACYTIPASGCTGTWQAGTLSCGAVMPRVMGGNVYTCTGYRLPTEAEWEFAARAETTTATYLGDLSGIVDTCTSPVAQPNLDGIAWWCRNDGSRSRTVGGKTPNGWGLYDMLGNVREWTWDWYTATLPGGTDPRVESTGAGPVSRGGSWRSVALGARAAYRYINLSDFQNYTVGVRLVRTAP